MPAQTINEINDVDIKYMITRIDEACKNKDKRLDLYHSPEEEVKRALAAFENRRDELSRIQSVEVSSDLLPAIAPLFETDTIRDLTIKGDGAAFQWTSSLEKCHNLTSLEIDWGEELTEFPSWIRHADSLQRLSVGSSEITSIPDWIGDLQSLTELSLKFNKNLKTLPDSIGNLKNLTMLDISGTPVEQLPGSIENLLSLKYVNICRTNIHTVPQSISSVKTFIDRTPVEIIPQKHSPSYREFVNCYYKLAKTIVRFSEKSLLSGFLSLEDEIELLGDDLFSKGIRLVVDGTDADVIRNLLALTIEREHDYYRKKLMEIALKGVLAIRAADSPSVHLFKLNSMVKIKDNPIDAAVVKLLAGDSNAFSNIDFDAAIQPEEEREEIRLIKRAVFIREAARPHREGLLAFKNHLDYEAIANRDIFEYGISMIGCDLELIDDVLTRLISHETDPVQKNIAMAKKEAALSILNGDNTRITILKLLAYFDKNVTKSLAEELLKD
jgi:Leucine-rich repeat (LRR) protein